MVRLFMEKHTGTGRGDRIPYRHDGIYIKSEDEIAAMRRAGRIVAGIIRKLCAHVAPGIRTRELDVIAVKELKEAGAVSSFKGYHGYPATICVSVNDEVVHGIPGERILREGDIVTIDFGAIYDGFHGDAAVTVPVGRVNDLALRLIEATRGALETAIATARAGARLGDIAAAIESYAHARGFSVIREYTGHGIGRQMHEDPQIPNCTEPPYGLKPGTGPLLKKGMTLAIEPMLTTGGWRTRVGADNWTVSTLDGSLAAHFEHTIAIDDTMPEVLTEGTYA
ncbi:MAG: type I methionyl aminopeptidase [Dehalococcoidales bacterium]|nr:type I methionyl aminopeptidase [Dehalococcoidales bacterium]